MNFYDGKRIVVTGAGGFVGTALSNRLVALGATVVGIDNLLVGDRSRISPEVDFHLQGVEQMPERLFEGAAVVFHAATVNQEMSEVYPELALETNVRGTLRVLENAMKAEVPRVVNISSVSVYGANDEPLTENSAVSGVSNYAITKIGGELYANFFNDVKGQRTVTVRLSNVYGPGMLLHSRYCGVIGRLAKAKISGEPFQVYGDGSDSRTYTYIDDVVDALVLCGFQERAVGETMNIAGEDVYTMGEVATYFGAPYEYATRRSVDVIPVRKIISDKAERILRWRPQVKLFWQKDCGADRMMAWATDFLASTASRVAPSVVALS